MKIKVICGMLLVTFFFTPAHAQMPFFIDGARPSGMGGAFTSVADDENAIFYNPAGLVQIKKKIISLSNSYQEYSLKKREEIDSIIFDFKIGYSDWRESISYILPIKNNLVFSMSMGFKREGDHKVGTVEITKEDKDRETGRVLYGLNYEEMILISCGIEVDSKLAIGVSGKYVKIDDELWKGLKIGCLILDKEDDFALDLGGLYKINDKISIGMLIQNIIAPKIHYFLHSYYSGWIRPLELPQNVNIGVCFKLRKNFLMAIDVSNLLEDEVDVAHESPYKFKRKYHIGTEIDISPNFVVRYGLSKERQAIRFIDERYKSKIVYAAGFGFQKEKLKIDFATTYDRREKEIEENSNWKVKHPTFRYLLSGNLQF